MKKLLLVGWDAADWKIINPLLAQGKMPALATLLANGSHGNLVTLDPPISPMLWTSIATGKRPFKHGIHGFTEIDPKQNTARPVRVTSRTAKAVWNILNDYALKTNVIGWWPSHPAEALNGVAVSNFFGVDAADNAEALIQEAVYPSAFSKALESCVVAPHELTSEILLPFFPDADALHATDDAILRSVMRILAQTASIQAAATYVMEHTTWQFTAVYFDAIDHLCHLAMKYHPPKMAGVADAEFKNYHYIVEAGYRFHDMMLQRLMALSGDDCAIVLVSDHGFESGEKRKMALPQEPGAPALEHNPYGIFVASGAAFTRGPVYGASLLDVTPTVLAYFDLPVGQDMDGKILPVFRSDKKNSSVPTHEESHASKAAATAATGTAVDAQLLKQLEALGYIDKIEQGAPEAILAENEYYLARSYADGGKIADALRLIEKLVSAFPDTQRYVYFKANLLLRSADYTGLEAFITSWPATATKTYYTALIYLQKGMPQKALATFNALGSTQNDQLLVQMARACMQAGREAAALEYANKAQALNDQNHAVHNLLGELALKNEDWEGALTHFFTSLKLLYYQPQIHFYIGTALFWLGNYSDAATALKLALQFRPGHLAAYELLKETLVTKLNKPNDWTAFNDAKMARATVVVTGHPRSGTSMMMQLLRAGGIPVATDNIREADQNNRKGYVELEAVKQLATDQSFLHACAGKAVKIVIPLLRMVQPFYPLKVIWMERSHTSTLKSQQAMLGKDAQSADFTLVNTMLAEEERLHQWLNTYPHISYIKVAYEEAVAQPQHTAKRVAAFLGSDFDSARAVAAIDQDLKHH